MAFLVITSTTTKVTVNYGVYGNIPINIFSKGTFPKTYLRRFELAGDGSFIRMEFNDGTYTNVTWDVTSTEYSIIESVDGAAPSSQSDLYTKLEALI